MSLPFSLFGLFLITILLIDKLADLIQRGTGHKKRVRIQRLVDAVASPGAVIIGEAVKQVTMTMGLAAAAVTGKAGKHVGDFRSGLVGFTGTPLE
jgi:hypothetical protein